MCKIVTIFDKPPCPVKVTLDELAWEAYTRNFVLNKIGNYLFIYDFCSSIFQDLSENNRFTDVVKLNNILFTKIDGKKRCRFVKYNYENDKAQLTNSHNEHEEYIEAVDARASAYAKKCYDFILEVEKK